MTEGTWRLLAVVGAAVFAVGLYLGFAPLKVAAIDGTLECGSAFNPKSNIFAGSLVKAECDSKRQDRKTWAIAALVLGGVVGVYSASQVSPAARRPDPEPSDPPSTVVS